jgi:hypothetical protein
MKTNQKHIDDEIIQDDENPEWTTEEFKKAISFYELPESLKKTLKGIQGTFKSKKSQILDKATP